VGSNAIRTCFTAQATQTLLQLKGMTIPRPLRLYDKPRYPHRGLLVDSARHYLPPAVLMDVMVLMSACKLNVMHVMATASHSNRRQVAFMR
jgi:N-acetyl-beta-hexosaminidase